MTYSPAPRQTAHLGVGAAFPTFEGAVAAASGTTDVEQPRRPPGAHAVLGRLGTSKLRPGHYRITIQAADASGNVSNTSQVSFTVVRR